MYIEINETWYKSDDTKVKLSDLNPAKLENLLHPISLDHSLFCPLQPNVLFIFSFARFIKQMKNKPTSYLFIAAVILQGLK